MSPSPAFSILITSAPSHARSCVHVGPDCTCVKSRILTPSNALLIPLPLCSAESRKRGRRLQAASRLFFRRPSLFLLRGRIETRDAAALRARLLVDGCVDQRRLARADRLLHRAAKLGR